MKRLTQQEKERLCQIENTYYMSAPLKELEKFISSSKLKENQSFKEAFNYIQKFMLDSQVAVNKILETRKREGLIRDISQARKSIVGNMFASFISYLFLKNKELGNISQNVFITNKSQAIKKFGEDFTIHIGEETQKPDCDLLIYNNEKKIIIISLKTSLRERAGQTYKWKLLLEIATSDNSIRDKYKIKYKGTKMPLVCFATVNFYDEINNPQQRGMFKFFDKAFIAKPYGKTDFVSNMSDMVEFIKEKL